MAVRLLPHLTRTAARAAALILLLAAALLGARNAGTQSGGTYLLREGDAAWGWFLLHRPEMGDGRWPRGVASLYMDCRGNGAPTVILDAGLNDASVGWGHDVPDDIASYTRVCRYDRLNTGRSQYVGGPRTSQDIVEDLHALLAAAHAEDIVGQGPPYVLVGHSFGGANVRLFASRYPDLVAGLVLLDAAALDVLPPDSQPPIAPVFNSESIDLRASVDQLRVAPPLPDVPLVAVTADLRMHNLPEHEQQARVDRHRSLAAQVPRGRHLIAENSDHYIHHSRPDLVKEVIREVIDVVRDSGSVTQRPPPIG